MSDAMHFAVIISTASTILHQSTQKELISVNMAARVKMNVQLFPRPPLLQQTRKHLQVVWNGQVIADTREAYWVLETHHPPSPLLSKRQRSTTFAHTDLI